MTLARFTTELARMIERYGADKDYRCRMSQDEYEHLIEDMGFRLINPGKTFWLMAVACEVTDEPGWEMKQA